MNISNIFVLKKTLEKLLTEEINSVLLDEFQNIADIVSYSSEEQHLVEELRYITNGLINLYKKNLPETVKLVEKINKQKTIEQKHLSKKFKHTIKLVQQINEQNFTNELFNQELEILSLDQTDSKLDLLINKITTSQQNRNVFYDNEKDEILLLSKDIETSRERINRIYNETKKELSLWLEETKIIKEKIHSFHVKVKDEFNQKKDLMTSSPNSLGPTWTANNDRKYRQIVIDSDLLTQIANKIRKFTDWRYPTLEIGPGDGRWTDHLVGSDPLYLIDIHKEYLDIVKQKYPKKFSDRIRAYHIDQHNRSWSDFSDLPINQMGFIFSWGVFDFYSYEQVDVLLANCNNLLRPGGTLTFSYNDCDYVSGIQLFEQEVKTWLTKDLLSNLFDKYQLTLLEFESNSEQDTFWVTVKKPGEKQSIKKSQPLISIHLRSGFEKVDKSNPVTYNNQQIARIKQLAITLGIDTEENIMNDKYRTDILLELVNIARMKK